MSRWEFLSPLTRRGHALLWAGVGLTIVSLLFGQRDFVRVGILLTALPLLCLFLMARTKFRLSLARTVAKNRIPVNGTTTSALRLHNVSRLSSGLLLVEDAMPWELGRPQRLVVDQLGPNQWRDVATTLHGSARGRYTLGPASLTFVDPFGLCRTTKQFSKTDVLTVVPTTVPLPSSPLHGDWSGVGESRARAIASHGDDDVIPREYRIGDDLRRVHWKSTARSGELMVRREEQPWRNRVTLILDTRAGVHRGEGNNSSFEWSVTAAASIGAHLLQSGFGVRIVTADGTPLVSSATSTETLSGSESVGALLDLLATVEDDADTINVALTHSDAFTDGVIIALLGDLTIADAEHISALRPSRGVALALLLDTSSWSGRNHIPDDPSVTRTCALFNHGGWRTFVYGRDTDLPQAWRSLTINSLAGAS
jgi:uncharacterized protein (DUF58 family)